ANGGRAAGAVRGDGRRRAPGAGRLARRDRGPAAGYRRARPAALPRGGAGAARPDPRAPSAALGRSAVTAPVAEAAVNVRKRLARALDGSPEPLAVEAPPALLEVARDGVVPLSGAVASRNLDIAAVVPPFRRGSGGHSTVMHLLRGLEARGHRCSVWIEGDGDRRLFGEWFGAP